MSMSLNCSRFQECNKLSAPVLQLDEVNFGYTPDKLIFKNLNVSADADSRICIVSILSC